MKEQNTNNINKYMHISFDDVYSCLFDIIKNNYKSVFQNSFFASLKNLHDTYGAVFSLFCFNTHTAESGYDISDFPERYANEFNMCSGWLKFGFHAEDEATKYNIGCPEQIKASYNKFIKAILKATGTPDCIDTVTRLGFFTGTLSDIKAIQQCDYGITGLLTADDTRVSYYFSEAYNQKVIAESMCFDSENALLLIRSQTRLEKITEPLSALNGLQAYDKNIIEIFTHEQRYNGSVPDIMKQYIEWAVSNNYKFGYAKDVI